VIIKKNGQSTCLYSLKRHNFFILIISVILHRLECFVDLKSPLARIIDLTYPKGMSCQINEADV
jgi:hypothetical protein